MGTEDKRTEGKQEELRGKVKEDVGELIDEDRASAEKRAEEFKGKAERAASTAGERIKGEAEKAKGAVKEGFDKLSGKGPASPAGTPSKENK